MSHSSNSENCQSQKGTEAASPLTPFSSIASPDRFSIDTSEEFKRSRRNSNVHWKEDGPLIHEQIHSPSPLAKETDTLQYGGEDWAKRQYAEILEEHTRLLNTLENRLQSIELPRSSDFSERGDGSSERSGLSTEPQWMTWQEYLEPTGRATNILEVLIEKPHTNSRRKSSGVEATSKAPANPASADAPFKNIERIRIRSLHIINALQQITEQTFPNSSCFTIHRPFKILLLFKDHIEEHVAELEAQARQNPFCNLGEKCSAMLDADHAPSISSSSYSPHAYGNRAGNQPIAADPSGSQSKGSNKDNAQNVGDTYEQSSPSLRIEGECRHEVSEDMLVQREAIAHLRALLKFMTEEMHDRFERHHLLRSSEADLVLFADLWHLFMAGDLVVTNNESKPMIYRVSILPAGQFFPSRRPVKSMKLKSDGSHQVVKSIYAQESMNVSTVDVFSYEFDGQAFGPVETRITIVSYDGLRKITDLPVYPLRFRKDASSFQAEMLERGRKYRDLLAEPHWEYNGLSVAEPQEQIDSQVIIDVPLAYRKHPDTAPKFGLKSWVEDDARIVTEACGVPGCTECFKERFMFDDHRIDRQQTVEFMKMNAALLRVMTDVEELTDEILLLLPCWIYGFVLRSRRWYFLNVKRIHRVQRQSEGFESLILPQGVARLVEGLVQTHGPRDKAILTPEKQDSEHQFDLVRGKGKGLIILLHGAPGVGKTSTAECVADYTHRPLFPITCGDVGETAKEVEQNLEYNFSLAHRWGCVLLLDEADVFLQARDKEDMRRNAVVSVFLRVLEYYSGILFLTTNKVGHFDEAFKSRIHISLYYPPLDAKSTMQVWRMNLRRLADSQHQFEVDEKAIERYAKKHFKELMESKSMTWNGRQIKNAFQTAIALAEFEARTKDIKQPMLTKEHFKTVTKAAKGFDTYLARIHGTDTDRARREGQRDDDRSKPVLFPLNEHSDSTSSDDSEDDKRKVRKKSSARPRGKSKARTKGKPKAEETSASSSEFSSSEETEKKEKRAPKKQKSSRDKPSKVARSKSKARARASDDSTTD